MGKLFVLATPIGNLSDITKRALETISNCDFIACEDTRNAMKLLSHFGIKKKLVSYHKFNEKEKSLFLVEEIKKNNKNIVLISDAGSPCISDPGVELVRTAVENDIDVVGIPGCSAVITSLMVSGIDTTSFSFYGFLPRKRNELISKLEVIKYSDVNTFVLYESPNRIMDLLKCIDEVLPSSYICLCNDLTKLHERIYYGNTIDVMDKLINNPNFNKGEYTLVVHKQDFVIENNNVSVEALLFEEMYLNKRSVRDAVSVVSKRVDFNKSSIYNKALEIKNMLTK